MDSLSRLFIKFVKNNTLDLPFYIFAIFCPLLEGQTLGETMTACYVYRTSIHIHGITFPENAMQTL
jgi:hypothetical protein